MNSQGKEWFADLQQYIQQVRQRDPLPDRSVLSIDQEMQCRIIGGSVLSWLREHGPHFLQERQVLHKMMEVSPDPWIVFTSNLPGLIAAKEIIGQDSEQIAYLSDYEYEKWLRKSPDIGYDWHVHFWSFFLDELQSDFLKMATRQHPIPASCIYWQHVEGTMWGKLAGQGGDHLWKWDGTEPVLLEEALVHWVS